MTSAVKVLVMTGYGLNCERETPRAFELAGAEVTCVHLNDLFARSSMLLDFHVLAFVGGFSFGDHLGAGTVLANRLRHRVGSELNEFITSGRLAIGICNGFQTMTRLGLVPALDGAYFRQQAALTHNDQGVFRNAWVTLKCNPESSCVFTRGIDILPLPIRQFSLLTAFSPFSRPMGWGSKRSRAHRRFSTRLPRKPTNSATTPTSSSSSNDFS